MQSMPSSLLEENAEAVTDSAMDIEQEVLTEAINEQEEDEFGEAQEQRSEEQIEEAMREKRDHEDDPNFVDEAQKKQKKYNRMDTEELTRAADRAETRSGQTVEIYNASVAVLMRHGFIDVTGSQVPVFPVPDHILMDPKTMETRRQKDRMKANDQYFATDPEVKGLFIDGKGAAEEFHGKKPAKEYFSMVAYPFAEYLGCFGSATKSAARVAAAVLTFFVAFSLSTAALVLIGSDGEAANTGYAGGLAALLEAELGRPLQRVVCLLHLVELVLRKVFNWANEHAVVKSASSFTGPIGSKLKDDCLDDIAEFDTIPCPYNLEKLPPGMSSDQEYLAKVAKVVATGIVPPGFKDLLIGKLNLSRWITLASRVLRLYISTQKPSKKLRVLVEFIMRVSVV